MTANISDETRNEFVSDLQDKLRKAYDTKKEFEAHINSINLKIKDYSNIMTLLGVSINDLEDITETENSQNSEVKSNEHPNLRRNFTWSQKIVAILDNPAKYGFHLYKGIDDIFNAIAKEFSEPTDKDNTEKVKRTLAPTVSRLINNGEIVKVKKNGTKSEFYQISPKWFTEVEESKRPLPEYEEILRDYEIVE